MSQAGKNFVLLLVGVAVAGGLVAYAYFGVMKGEEQETHQKDVNDRVFQAVAEVEKPKDGGSVDVHFQSLEVQAKGDTTKLEKQGDHWRVVSPVQAPADSFAVDGLSSQLQTAKFKQKVEEKPTDADLEKYGLKTPKFTVTGTASFPDGTKKTVKLEGGIDNTFDGSVYMRREGDPAVYTAEGGLRYALEKSTFDLRDKQLLDVEEPKLSRIDVKSGPNSYLLVRDDKRHWRLEKPESVDAEQGSVTALVASIRGERVQAFLEDSAAKRKELGLDSPKVDGTFVADGKTVHLRINSLALDAGTKTYALVEGDGSAELAEVSPTALTSLDKTADNLKDRSILKFDANAISKVTFEKPGDTIVVAKAHGEDGGHSDRWQVLAPKQGAAKPFKVSALLWSLSNLKATSYGDAHPKDWKKFGIDDKSERVKFEDDSGKVVAELVRGKEVPGKSGQLYARGSADQVVEIEAQKLAEIWPNVNDLMEAPPSLDGGVAKVAP